jgi:putative ABC transport system permease protein
MERWQWLVRRWEVLFRKHSAERELDDELRFHIEREIRDNIVGGMPATEARRRALVAFGSVERMKEEVRDVRGARILDDAARDVVVAMRGFGRQPVFLATVLLTLAIGIGGNVAMFGILEAVLFRPLPYAAPDRLVLGRVTYDGRPGNTISAPDYFDVREQARTFASLSAFTPFAIEATVTGAGDPEVVRAPYASPDLFRTLGVDPVVGRHFLPEEGEPGGEMVAMLSHGYWQRRFAGDPAIVGTSLIVDGSPTTIVGVLPERFRFHVAADVWRAMVRDGQWAQSRQFNNFVMIGRLAPGSDVAAAQSELNGITSRLEQLHPDSNRGKGMYLTPLHEAIVAGYRLTLIVLATAVAALLLVACANVAGILMARGNARRTEMALRSVMGASRSRLIRQLLTENMLLATGATVLGVLVASLIQRGILSFISLERLGELEAGLSATTIGAAAILAFVTLALFGLLPALRAARTEPARELASGGARSGGSREAARLRSVLVVTQVALTAVLLMISGLLYRSFDRLLNVDPGFTAEGLLTAETPLPAAKYQEIARRPQLFAELQRRIAELPGVDGVGITSHLPIRDPGNTVRVATIEDWAGNSPGGRMAYQRMILPGYFDAMGIPQLAGRDVSLTDERSGPYVVVLGESLAAALFPDGSPLGRVLGVEIGGDEPYKVEVVGVVGDVAPASLINGRDVTMYFPYGQRSPSSMRLAVRTRGDAFALVPRIRGILRDLDPDVPLASVAMMDDVVSASIADRRSVVLVLGAFAAVALLLSAVGLYGVLAYHVSRRVREIGVRMALGATIGSVSKEIVTGGLRLVAFGLLLGLPVSAVAARLVQGMLFDIGATDPVTFAAVAVSLAGVALLACYFPARRAARVDPAQAFRSD